MKKENIRVMFVIDNTKYVIQFVRNEEQILSNDCNFDIVLNSNIKQDMIMAKKNIK